MILFSKSCVGIDIDAHAIHIVTLQKKRRRAELRMRSKTCMRQDALSLLLKYCYAARAMVAIPHEYCQHKTIALKARLTELEVALDLKQNLKRYMPEFEPGDLYDFMLTKSEVNLMLAKHARIAPLIKNVQSNGIKVACVCVKLPGISAEQPTLPLPEEWHTAYRLSAQGLLCYQ